MYYEEKIIDGKLHWRHSPDGLWRPFTEEWVATKYMEKEKQLNWYMAENKRLRDAHKNIIKTLESYLTDDENDPAVDAVLIAEEALKEKSDEKL